MRDKTALLVIDVQKGLFERSTRVYRADDLLDTINALVGRAHHAGAPVVYVQHANKGNLKKGTDGWQLHPRLKPAEGDLVIQKQHGNAFEETELDHEWR
jgi:nicotinamidase-related amidase